MELGDKIGILAQRVAKLKDSVETEEATKNAFIMPFLQALGYDVFDPGVVVPEFTADIGIKKGEKVDYAIKIEGKIALLIECKPCKSALSTDHMSQLLRYYTVTEARFGLLTNGIQYWFFTDLDQPNVMDTRPFFEFDILNYRSAQLEELNKFANDAFNVETILETASELRYRSSLMKEISSELETPSDDFIKLLVGRVYEGNLTINVRAKFAPVVVRAIKDTIREIINQRLASAIDDTAKTALSGTDAIKQDQEEPVVTPLDSGDEILTTKEEMDGFQIIRAIVREVISVERVRLRDAKSYCAILVDDNNRKPLCRLHFNGSKKYIGIFDESKAEVKYKIENVDGIFEFSAQLKGAAMRYDSKGKDTELGQ